MKRLALTISFVFISFAATMVFQNCGGAFMQTDVAGSAVSPVSVKTGLPGTSYSQLTGFQNLDYSLRRGSLKNDVTQCLNSADACVFWRSPYATSWLDRNLLSDPPTGDAPYDAEVQNHQLFAVSLAGLVTTGALKNAHFDIFYTDQGGLPERITLTSNKWAKSFSEGHSPSTPLAQQFAIEQIQSYLAVNTFRDAMVADGGGFYASNGNIGVDVLSVATKYNVNFDSITNTIYSGIRFGKEGRYYPLSLSSELIVREAARANFFYANRTLGAAKPAAIYAIPCNAAAGKPYYVTDGANLTTREGEVLNRLRFSCGHSNVTNVSIFNYCPTDAGCWKAIELGQADFFTYVMFAGLPSIGEVAFPLADVRYWKKRSNVNRSSVAANFGVSYYDDFAQKPVSYAGDVKGMSEFFADLLFDIYTDAGVDKPIFLKTVSKFLAQTATTSTFVDAKNILIAIDQNDFAARNGTRIRALFTNRGYQ